MFTLIKNKFNNKIFKYIGHLDKAINYFYVNAKNKILQYETSTYSQNSRISTVC